MELAEWLRAERRYRLALREVERALEVSAEHGPALELRLQLRQQVALLDRRVRAEEERAGDRPERPRVPVLTEDQINLMRVYLIDLDDPGRVVMPRKTIDALIG